jgi:hypothetical protein
MKVIGVDVGGTFTCAFARELAAFCSPLNPRD